MRDSFRAFCRWAERHRHLEDVPHFEAITPDPHVADVLSVEEPADVLAAMSWEELGHFFAGGSHALRLSELRAFTIADYRDGKLRLNKAVQGRGWTRASGPRRTRSASGSCSGTRCCATGASGASSRRPPRSGCAARRPSSTTLQRDPPDAGPRARAMPRLLRLVGAPCRGTMAACCRSGCSALTRATSPLEAPTTTS